MPHKPLGFRMRVRTVGTPDGGFIKAFVCRDGHPEDDVENVVEIGRIALAACERDRAFYDRWFDVMNDIFKAAAMAVMTEEGVNKITFFLRKSDEGDAGDGNSGSPELRRG